MSLIVTIAGVTKPPLVDSLDISLALNARAVCNLSIDDKTGAYAPAEGLEVAVYDGATKIYGGSIDQVTTILKSPGSVPLRHDILSVGFERWIDKRLTFDPSTAQVFVYKSYSGTVDTAGTGVVWKTGDFFDPDLEGFTVLINGVPYVVDTPVTGPKAMTLTTFAGTQTDVAFSFTWTAGAIFADLLNKLIADGENFTAGTISAGADITKLILDYQNYRDAFDNLAQLSGYIWYSDPSQVVSFVARSTVAAPFSIGSSSKILDISIRKTREDYRNTEAIRASFAGYNFTTEVIVGDSVATAWRVTGGPGGGVIYRIASIDSMDLNGTAVTFGSYGVDTDKDFYFYPGGRIISQDPAGVVLTGADTLTVRYRALGTDVVVYEDGAAITERLGVEGGSGRYQHFTDDSANADVNGVLAKATALVSAYSEMPREVRYRTSVALIPLASGLRPGQLQPIVIDKLGINAQYLISKVRMYSQAALPDGSGDRTLWYDVTAVTGTYLADWLTTFQKFVAAGPSGSSTSTISGSGSTSTKPIIAEVTGFSAAQAVDVTPTTVGAQLIVKWTQNGTGGNYPAWSANFAPITSANVKLDANEVTMFQFVLLSDLLWWPTSYPVLQE